MANNRAFDSLEWSSLDFPYNRVLRELSEQARIVAGKNSYVTFGGKLVKRPGTLTIANTTASTRADRLWLYETIESPPKVYIMASMFNAGTWELFYNRLDGGSPGWTTVGSLRAVNASTRPHEGVVSRGKFYAKGYPSGGSGEKLGSVIFDGSGGSPSLKFWGLLGPTTPARISGVIHNLSADITSSSAVIVLDSVASEPATPFNVQIDYELLTVISSAGGTSYNVLRGAQGTAPAAHVSGSIVLYRNWSSSAHNVVVNLGWQYSYAYVSATGQVSNRAPVETDPTQLPSNTGPFLNLIPKITVQGQTDTTNIPSINIYRSTDGGGTYYFLEKITNTGSGAITYEDKSLLGTDPVTDSAINIATSVIAPSLTSNSPPPTVTSPLVVGTDTPTATTPIVYYSGRFWLGIGNYLFYSANEELNSGVPEESWPSGFLGNFFLFQHPLQNLVATTDSLYITTLGDTYELTGTLRETFNPKPILNDIGAPYGHPRSAARYQDAMVWLTNDLRIAVLQGQNFKISSDPLGDDLVTAINAGGEVDIKYWADLEKEFIVVSCHIAGTPTTSKQWVYDIKKAVATKEEFWHTPWTIHSTASASGRIRETESQRRLLFYVWTGSTGFLVRLASLNSENVGSDDIPGALASSFDFLVDTALFQTPPGNHVNALRRPALYPNIEDFRIDRTKFTSDTDPTVSYFLDDLWTTPISPPTPLGSPRAQDPKGYKTLIYQVNNIAKRIGIRIAKTGSTDKFEIQNLMVVFEPDKGV